MEVGGREAVQFLTIAASLFGAFAVVKAQLGRALIDLKKASEEIDDLKLLINDNRRADMNEINTKLNEQDSRIDGVIANDTVAANQIQTFREILSPSNLATQRAEVTELKVALEETRKVVDQHRREYLSAHNGSHPPVTS